MLQTVLKRDVGMEYKKQGADLNCEITWPCISA